MVKYVVCGNVVEEFIYEKILGGYRKNAGRKGKNKCIADKQLKNLERAYFNNCNLDKNYNFDLILQQYRRIEQLQEQNIPYLYQEISRLKEKNREIVLMRARRDIRNFVNANVYQYYDDKGNVIFPKFLTLTFKDNIKDLKVANENFKNFIKRMNYYLKIKLKYLYVREFQKRGAVHFHCIFFNMPYVSHSKLLEIWNLGSVNIKKIDDVDNVGAYVCKYLKKDMINPKFCEQRIYDKSRGLIKPLVIKDKDNELLFKKIKNQIDNIECCYQSSYESEYTGRVFYKQFNLSKCNNINLYNIK